MGKKSLGVNAFLNGFRNILNMIVPLFTLPYITRILGAVNLGKYNFANSIVSYFILVAGLGISTYAIREGAKYRTDEYKMSVFASEIFSINILSMLLAYILLFITVISVSVVNKYYKIIFIISLSICFTTIGCDWIFSIYEEYLYITIRGIIVQLVYVILLFIGVRSNNDLVKYCWIMLLSSSGTCLINIFELRKICRIHFTLNMNLKKHLPAIFIIFANVIATSIYTNSDMTILGILTSDYEVGIYTITVKIYNIVKQLLAAIIIVAVPRLSLLWGENKKKEFNMTLETIANMLFSLACPALVGIFSLSNEIVFIVGGNEFLEASFSLKIICYALLFSVFSWFFTDCILIPCKKEKKVLVVTIIAAVSNILFNFILIPYGKQNAAAFTTLMAEFISMILSGVYALKISRISLKYRNAIGTIIGCILIYLICLVFRNFNISIVLYLLLSIVGSAIIYISVQLVIRNPVYYDLFKKNMRIK